MVHQLKKVLTKQDAVIVEEETEHLKGIISGAEETEEPDDNKDFLDLPLSEQSRFICDVSEINPLSSSFAPDNFQFKAPNLPNFFEEDLLEALETVKQKFNRTSTPSKSRPGTTNVSPIELNDSKKEKSAMEEDSEPDDKTDKICKVTIRGTRQPHKSRFSSDCDFIFKETRDILINDNIFYEMDEKSPCIAEDNNAFLKKSPEKKNNLVSEPFANENSLEILESKNNECNITVGETDDENGANVKIKGTIQNPTEYIEIKSYGGENSSVEQCIKEGEKNSTLEAECSSAELFVKDEESNGTAGIGSSFNKGSPAEQVVKEEKNAAAESGHSFEIASSPGLFLKKEDKNKMIEADYFSGKESSVIKEEEVAGNLSTKHGLEVDLSSKSLLNEVKGNIFHEVQIHDELVSVTPYKNIAGKEGEQDEFLLFSVSPPEMPVFEEIRKVVDAQVQKLNDEDQEQNSDAIPKYLGRKSSGNMPKRVSMLKRVSVLNSIVETHEKDDAINQTPSTSAKKGHSYIATPRRSTRLSRTVLDSNMKSPFKKAQSTEQNQKNISDAYKKLQVSTAEEDYNLLNISPATRRSQRLLKAVPKDNESQIDVISPFEKENYGTPRRSMRLIKFDTPEAGACGETNLTADFERLKINANESLDPENFLIDLDSSPVVSKKVSLLYSPQKRRSMRRSIKGDLMSFSPSGNMQ